MCNRCIMLLCCSFRWSLVHRLAFGFVHFAVLADGRYLQVNELLRINFSSLISCIIFFTDNSDVFVFILSLSFFRWSAGLGDAPPCPLAGVLSLAVLKTRMSIFFSRWYSLHQTCLVLLSSRVFWHQNSSSSSPWYPRVYPAASQRPVTAMNFADPARQG